MGIRYLKLHFFPARKSKIKLVNTCSFAGRVKLNCADRKMIIYKSSNHFCSLQIIVASTQHINYKFPIYETKFPLSPEKAAHMHSIFVSLIYPIWKQ
jgi:hypothetical protein